MLMTLPLCPLYTFIYQGLIASSLALIRMYERMLWAGVEWLRVVVKMTACVCARARWHVFVCVSVHAKKKKKKKTVIWPWWACIMPGCDTQRVVQKHPHLTIQRAAFRADGGSMNFSAAGLQTKHLPAVCEHFMSNWDTILQAEAQVQSPNIF